MKDLNEKQYLIAGVDEAGRGPLAGPVVAAACILLPDFSHSRVADSKTLSESLREQIYEDLITSKHLHYSIGIIDVEGIDTLNILKATLEAMRIAVENLPIRPNEVLVDGPHVPFISMPCEGVIRGDSIHSQISAASIIAKVTRDRMMREYHEKWPVYGFAGHKGYGTKKHLDALLTYGPCPIHRKSFAPIKDMLQK